MPNTYPLAADGPWYRDVTLWIQIVMQAVTFTLTGLVFGLPPATSLPFFASLLCFAGLAVTFVGLLVQRWRARLGLVISGVGLAMQGISAVQVYFLAYFVVCFEAWYIAAYVRRKNRWWLAILWCGSMASVAWGYLRVNLGGDYGSVPQVGFLAVVLTLLITASIGLSTMLGRSTAKRNEKMETLAARAELATVSERNRIAREMHDIVAHSLTVVIAQADGGRYAGRKDPDKAMEALETISARGRDALSQMRSLLSVLHDDSQDEREVSVAPGVAGIPDLVSDAKRSGLTVDYQVEGEPQSLEEVRDLTVYRIVQESLTNVMKHAGSVRVVLRMQWSKEKVRIDVDNQRGEDQIEGSGRGLTGIAERARVHGGTATWGPSRLFAGGWNVTAELPTGR